MPQICALLLDLQPIDLPIDHIHHIPKPPFFPDTVPRDVLMRVHFYSTKDQILRQSRSLGKLPDPYESVLIFTDLSNFTVDLRHQLNIITKALQNHNIGYKWGHPTKLSVDKNGRSVTITSLESGLALLKEWGIIPDPQPPSSSWMIQGPVTPLWHKANHNFQPKF